MKKVIALVTMASILVGIKGVAYAKIDSVVNRVDGTTRYETSVNVPSNYSNSKLENTPVISDKAIKELLFSGDEAFQNMLKIKVDEESCINISGISYGKVMDNLNKYNSIYQYLNTKYKLDNYYNDEFIKSIVGFVFNDVDGRWYMRYGNPEPILIVKDSEIVAKKYDGNKVYVTLKGYYFGPDDVSYANAVLIFDGNRWLIHKFDNWGLE